MKKYKKSLCLCFALLLMVVLFSSMNTVYAASSKDIDVISRTELNDNYMAGYGWLSVTANPPDDFKEILCLELYNSKYGRVSIELNPFDWYISGEWLHNGTYTVKKAYVIGNDEIPVECNQDKVVISHDEDAYLVLSLVEVEDTQPTQESAPEDIETEAPTIPTEPTELPTIPETEPTETEVPVLQEPEPAPDEKPDILFFVVMIGMGVVLLIPCFFVYMWYKRNQE